MSKQRIILASMLMLTLLTPVTSQAFDFAVDVHAGLNGTGVGAAIPLNKRINLRAGFNSSDIDYDVDDDEGLDLQGSFEWDNQYLFFDFYPRKRGKFHFTLGIVSNDNAINATATVTDNNTFVGAETALVGTQVATDITFDSTSYYAGIGIGNAFGKKNTVHFGFDFGLLAQGSPDATVTVSYPGFAACANGDPSCIGQDDVDTETADVETEIEDFDLFPIINFSFGVRF